MKDNADARLRLVILSGPPGPARSSWMRAGRGHDGLAASRASSVGHLDPDLVDLVTRAVDAGELGEDLYLGGVLGERQGNDVGLLRPVGAGVQPQDSLGVDVMPGVAAVERVGDLGPVGAIAERIEAIRGRGDVQGDLPPAPPAPGGCR